MKHPPIIKPIPQVLAELEAVSKELHANAEIERSWVWLVCDLRGEENKALRQAIGRQGIGFQFAVRGHTLPSGRIGNWSHHCERPTKFTRKGKKSTPGATSDAVGETNYTDDQLLAALG